MVILMMQSALLRVTTVNVKKKKARLTNNKPYATLLTRITCAAWRT
jgi:hypothetical protein